MFSKVILAVLLCGACSLFLFCSADENANDDYYIAGAVEYSQEQGNVTPGRIIANNLKAYLDIIDLAKTKNVDILVFPEATFNYNGIIGRKALMENAILLPDPKEKVAPCDHVGKYDEALTELSKRCKQKQIYVLVNIVEKEPYNAKVTGSRPFKTHHDGYDVYNTNIVFDRQGRIISRYRKMNLYIEPDMDVPFTQDIATFTTDFNVKFGHMICFDILFKNPALNLVRRENLTHILFSTMWFSDLPYLTSTQFHEGWAYANNINLISASTNLPQEGSTGSGLYLGRKQIANIVMSPKPLRKLYTARIPKRNLDNARLGPSNREAYSAIEMQKLKLTEYWSDMGFATFEIPKNTERICVYNDICCTFDIKMKQLEVPPGKRAYRYVLQANYTTKILGEIHFAGELSCAVLSCTGSNEKTCGRRFKDRPNLFQAVEFDEIKIKAKVKVNSPDDILVMPSTLDTSILPLDVSDYSFSVSEVYKESGSKYQNFEIASRKKLPEILTFGLFGRNFAADRLIKPRRRQ